MSRFFGAIVKLSSPGMVCGNAVLLCVFCASTGAALASRPISASRSGARNILKGGTMIIIFRTDGPP
ncbi:hypothetical protein EAH79_00020 [Sphingomonas koreensis]|nr:hypothetical protein EAH79_00020 [Sphingomonas koreensis]